MIACVFGTTGELIKLAPVLVRLARRGSRFVLITTGQQATQIPSFLGQFGLRQPDMWLARGAGGRDLAVSRDIPGWTATVARRFARRRSELRRLLLDGPGRPLLLVHGDTMTTVLGALMGRTLRVTVAHIEGGLRSGNVRHPFPEELNRRITGRLASLHYAPGAEAVSNLDGRGVVVDTESNTVRDSLELVPASLVGDFAVPSEPFGIVSLHRFELLNSATLLESTIRTLAAASAEVSLLFVDHPVTVAALERHNLMRVIAESEIRRIPRLRFFDFVQLERQCSFVVTDSGGSQQECYYLDRPCLVHRRRTEWKEGLGENTVLSGFDTDVLREFLIDPSRHRRLTALPRRSPGDLIVADLVERGYAAAG
jgi:UDP-N-acetylglucosamine 2-epimerase (non-hydrolysing)